MRASETNFRGRRDNPRQGVAGRRRRVGVVFIAFPGRQRASGRNWVRSMFVGQDIAARLVDSNRRRDAQLRVVGKCGRGRPRSGFGSPCDVDIIDLPVILLPVDRQSIGALQSAQVMEVGVFGHLLQIGRLEKLIGDRGAIVQRRLHRRVGIVIGAGFHGDCQQDIDLTGTRASQGKLLDRGVVGQAVNGERHGCRPRCAVVPGSHDLIAGRCVLDPGQVDLAVAVDQHRRNAVGRGVRRQLGRRQPKMIGRVPRETMISFAFRSSSLSSDTGAGFRFLVQAVMPTPFSLNATIGASSNRPSPPATMVSIATTWPVKIPRPEFLRDQELVEGRGLRVRIRVGLVDDHGGLPGRLVVSRGRARSSTRVPVERAWLCPARSRTDPRGG